MSKDQDGHFCVNCGGRGPRRRKVTHRMSCPHYRAPKVRRKDRRRVRARRATGEVFWPKHSYPAGQAVQPNPPPLPSWHRPPPGWVGLELDRLGDQMAADPE